VLSPASPASVPQDHLELVLPGYLRSLGARVELGSEVVDLDSAAEGARVRLPGLAIGGSQLLIWAIYQPSTFQVDLASGRVKPFWVYTPAGEFPEAVAW
jgi:hypothetical protein